MLKISNFEVVGWGHAIRGMRNPMNSWEKSDSYIPNCCGNCDECIEIDCQNQPDMNGGFVLGLNDLNLMKRLRKGGLHILRRLPSELREILFSESILLCVRNVCIGFLLHRNHSFLSSFQATMKKSFQRNGCFFICSTNRRATSAFTFSQLPVSITYPFSDIVIS